MKKTIAWCLTLCLLLGILTGCSQNQPSEGSGQDAESGEKVVINIYDWDASFDTSIIDRFNEKYPDIKAVYNVVPDNNDKMTKLDVLAMGGGEVDVMTLSDGDQFLRMQNGILAPVDEFIEADGMDMEELYGSHAEWAKYDGKYYGLPLRVSIEGVFYNKDMFDEAGIPYPTSDWTYDDYIEIARQLVQGEGANKVYGTYLHTWNCEWNGIGCQADLYYTEDGKCNFDNAAFRKALEVRKMLDEEGVQQSYDEINALNAFPNSAFLGGKCAMAVVGSWLVRDMKDKDNFPFDFNVGWVNMPKYDDSVGDNPVNSTVSILGIPATSKNKEAAWKFMRFYAEECAVDIAAQGNVPCYQMEHNEELIETFLEGSGLDLEYGQMMFSPELTHYSCKIGAPPQSYATSAQYDMLANEEIQAYFGGGQDLDTTIANIVEKVNEMLEDAD